MKEAKLTYEGASKRLREIVEEIEAGNCDLDKLSGLVKEANELYKFLNKKIFDIETEVNKVLENNELKN